MLGLVDTAIMGHLGTAAYIGAIAVGSTMFNMLYWLFGFLRMGTAGLTAQACGASDGEAQAAILWRSLLISAVGGILLIALSDPLGSLVLRFIDADDSVTPLAQRYFDASIWGAPAMLATYTLNGWFLGMKNTSYPMWIAISCNVLNIILSATLVFGCHLDILGCAIGTATAQWTAALAALTIVLVHYRPRRVGRRVIMAGPEVRRLMSVNVDIFLRTLCLVAVTVWFTRQGAMQGVDILAANSLLMQLFMFFSYFCDGFAYAGESLAGNALGAGDRPMLKQLRGRLLRWAAGVSLAFFALYLAGGDEVIGLLTDNADVRAVAHRYMIWAALVPLCGVVAFIYDGIFIGITATRRMLWSVFVAAVLFVAVLASLYRSLGNHALWLTFVVYLFSRGVYLHFAFDRILKGHR